MTHSFPITGLGQSHEFRLIDVSPVEYFHIPSLSRLMSQHHNTNDMKLDLTYIPEKKYKSWYVVGKFCVRPVGTHQSITKK